MTEILDPDAPWGRRKDGSPRKKPGNPKGSNAGGGRRPQHPEPVVRVDNGPALQLTEEVAEKVIDALLNGATKREAAYLANVKPATMGSWIEKGCDGEGPEPYGSFSFAVNQAIVVAGGKLRDPIRRAAEDGNTSDAKWLLTNHPEYRTEYGETKDTTPSVPVVILAFPGEREIGGKPLQIESTFEVHPE